MSYTLYGARGSGSAAIEMALRAAGQGYRVVHAARWEQAEYDRRVTDWDVARGFERA